MTLPPGDIANFKTLCRAFHDGPVALMEVERRADKAVVSAIVVLNQEDDDNILITPFAIMVEGNPFTLYNPPDPDGTFYQETENGANR